MFQSFGLKRSISVVLFLIAQSAQVIPEIVPYVGLINEVAAMFGIAGIGHAIVAETKKRAD
jgi:hypothetical protein